MSCFKPNCTSETSYQPTPGETNVEGQPGDFDGGMNSQSSQFHSSFDTGYFTDPWGTESSQQTTGHFPTNISALIRQGDVDCSMPLH
jgi:hypothetical protein